MHINVVFFRNYIELINFRKLELCEHSIIRVMNNFKGNSSFSIKCLESNQCSFFNISYNTLLSSIQYCSSIVLRSKNESIVLYTMPQNNERYKVIKSFF